MGKTTKLTSLFLKKDHFKASHRVTTFSFATAPQNRHPFFSTIRGTLLGKVEKPSTNEIII